MEFIVLGSGTAFRTQGRTGRVGVVQTYTIPTTTYYIIKAAGAKGGTHITNYGSYPGTFCGGKGATMQGKFLLAAGTVLNIVVGHRGGNSVEVKGGQSTTQTAASLGLSIEDNAGTGGGGGTFVYKSDNTLLVAAGGGGNYCYCQYLGCVCRPERNSHCGRGGAADTGRAKTEVHGLAQGKCFMTMPSRSVENARFLANVPLTEARITTNDSLSIKILKF